MMRVSRLQEHHEVLLNMMDEISPLLNMDNLRIKPNARTAHQLICDLADRVKAHLTEEDKGLYPSLLIHEDPKIKSIAWGFISGEKPIRQMFDDYYKKWLKDCDFNFSPEFISETKDVFELIRLRIDREQSILFPKLREIHGLEAARVAV